jgi:hypothetical protein
LAQQSNPVGVSLVIVNFDQPPDQSLTTVTKAPLKYNKDFALTMQIDDGGLSIWEQGFPVFEGGTVNGTPYPGYTYSDGCGNLHHFKMSSVLYSFNGENGPDVHINNAYDQVSWDQLNTMVQSGWGVINHGINGDANTSQEFMDYSISRNQSYIRRQLYETIDGGVITSLHANPNGSTPWTQAAEDLGYLSTYNQNSPSPLGDHGGNVNKAGVNWSDFQNIYRVDAGPTNIQNFVSGLADSSNSGANYWGSMFTHSLLTQYSFASFVSDFNYIYNNFGSAGNDNILMTSDEEVRDYLLIRDTVEVTSLVTGNSLYIIISGDVPNNLKYYSMSLNINSNANITGYVVNGSDDYTFNGVGSTQGLLNFNWDGLVITPAEELADNYTSIAVASNSQYDAWIAMDYVTTLDEGQHKDSLRHVLCDMGLDYDAGFCSFLTLDLGPDTTICQGSCVTLTGPDNMSVYEWIVADTLYASTQSIVACPMDTTQYKLTITDEFGNTASDSINVNVLTAVIFDLGNDTTMCMYQNIELTGPTPSQGGQFDYLWSTGETTQSITAVVLSDTLFYLDVTNPNTCISTDSIYIFANETPVIDSIIGNTIVCPGDSTILEVVGTGIEDYLWSTGDTTASIHFLPDIYDTVYTLSVMVSNQLNCHYYDTVDVHVMREASIAFELDTLQECTGNNVDLNVLASANIVSFRWIYQEIDSITIFDELTLIEPLVSANIYVEGTSSGGCLVTDSTFLQILPYPDLTLSPDTSICFGDSVTLTVTGGSVYYWLADGDTISHDSIVKVSPIDTTIYQVRAAFDDSLCFSDTTVTVNVFPLPTTKIVYDTNLVCERTSVILLAEGADSYQWMPSETTEDIYEFTIADTTEIWLIGTSIHGCTLNDTLIINTLPSPMVTLSGLYTAYCETDAPAVLTGLPEGGEFSGEGVVDNIFDPQLAGPGVHAIVYALANDEGCIGYDTLLTTVYGGGQTIDLGPADTTLMPLDALTLDAGIGYDSYFWSTGSNLPSITVYGVDNPPGTYEYKVIALLNGCTNSGSINITFYDPDFIDNSKAGYISLYPNPNNGIFSIVLSNRNTKQTLRIFSLQGNMVYEVSDLTCSGEDCTLEVKLPNLTEGLYTIQLITGEQIFINKIMINN